jgi:AcrR family transcriptional regulator
MDRSLLAQHPDVGSALRPAPEAQRARLLDAMIRVVADRGYAAASVTDVVRAAAVSRTTFYELFTSKEACFLEAYRAGVDVLDERVRAAVHEADDDWRSQLRAGVRAYLRTLEAEPVFTRAYLLEIHAAGPAALEARAGALRRFSERYHASFEQAHAVEPALREPPSDALLVLCAGTEQLLAERAREGRLDDLAELEDVFCFCAEAVLLGPPTTHPTPPED